MKLLRVLLSILILLISACVSYQGYEQQLHEWVGRDVEILLENWGPPASTLYASDGEVHYVFVRGRSAVSLPLGHATYSADKSCRTTFIVAPDGLISRWRYEGNMCRA